MSVLGTWYNALGSVMIITAQSGSQIFGTYQSSVGDASGPYKLLGQINPSPHTYSQAISWTVVWTNDKKNAHSTTAWAGQYQPNPETGEEEIYVFWLLASEQKSENDWGATQIGQNTFTRYQPNEETVRRAHRRAGRSEPTW